MALTGRIGPKGYIGSIKFYRALTARIAPYVATSEAHEIAAAVDASASATAALRAIFAIDATVTADTAVTAALNFAHEIAAVVNADTATTAAIQVFVAHEIAGVVNADAGVTAALTVSGGWDGTLDTITPDLLGGVISRDAPTFMYMGNEAVGATELVNELAADFLTDSTRTYQSYRQTLR